VTPAKSIPAVVRSEIPCRAWASTAVLPVISDTSKLSTTSETLTINEVPTTFVSVRRFLLIIWSDSTTVKGVVHLYCHLQ